MENITVYVDVKIRPLFYIRIGLIRMVARFSKGWALNMYERFTDDLEDNIHHYVKVNTRFK